MEITNEEIEIISKISERVGIDVNLHIPTDVKYFYQGNFTICVIQNSISIGAGVSKRHPEKDKNATDVGVKLAFYRAAKDFVLCN